jgi:small subunit ribosomal protein S3
VGQKVHPIGFRLGITREHQAKWYADRRRFSSLLGEDLKLRSAITDRLRDAGVPRVDIERSTNQVSVTIHAAKPGIVIGKGGAKIEELRRGLEEQTGKRVRVNIMEIRQPEVNAALLARSVADQLERRVAFRRAVRQAVSRAMRAGARGVRLQVSGRLGGNEMARREWEREGRVPLHTLRADIDYGRATAHTTFGSVGVKAWIYRGDVGPGQTPVPPLPALPRAISRTRAAVPVAVGEEELEELPIPEGPAIFEPDEDEGGDASATTR